MRILLLTMMAMLAGISSTASAQSDYVAPTRVGIIGAMELEVQLYIEEMENLETTTIGGLEFHTGILHRQPVVVVKSGVGKVYAASAATLLIHKFNVHAVIFSGVAGGVDSDLNVGDIVIANKLHQHDLGAQTPDGFEWTENEFEPNELLSQIAYQSAMNTEFPVDLFAGREIHPKVSMGTIVTGDQFIMSDDYVDYLEEKFDAACTEMEGAAVAAVCQEFSVPYTVIRCLSDRADDVADVEFGTFVKYASRACSLIVLQMMDEVAKIQESILSTASVELPKSAVRTCRMV